MTFELDTSGTVFGCGPDGRVRWPDLDPFTQGYILAALRSFRRWDIGHWSDETAKKVARFDKITPAAIDRMLKDCERFQRVPHRRWVSTEVAGVEWFKCVQRGDYAPIGFPPLTLYINDQGQVCAR